MTDTPLTEMHLGIPVTCEIEVREGLHKKYIKIDAYLTGTGAGKYTQVYADGKYHATRKSSVQLRDEINAPRK